jgi:hypothetical protein
MGYISEVAFKAHFNNSTDRDKVIGRLSEDRQERVRKNAIIPDSRPVVYFHFEAVKWYTSDTMLGVMSGFADINALDALVEACQNAANTHDDADYVPNTGVFIRIGEEYDDIVEQIWEPRQDDLGSLPYPWDTASVQRFIDLDGDWDE